MSDMLRTIQKAAKAPYIVDGEPDIEVAQLRFEGDTRDALLAVGSRFHYNIEFCSSGCAVFRKRFDTVTQRPQAQPRLEIRLPASVMTEQRRVLPYPLFAPMLEKSPDAPFGCRIWLH